MKIFALLLSISCALAGEREEYLQLLKDSTLGIAASSKEGEIELVLDPSKIQEIEKIQKERLLKKGFQEDAAVSFSYVGVVAEDTYWLFIRDAVIFPNGSYGTYNRLVMKNSLDGPAGCAVLPRDKNGRYYLVLNFRHATRSWEWELARGLRKKGEKAEDAALRELHEETGFTAEKCVFLGDMAPDTGSLSTVVPIFLVDCKSQGKAEVEDSEAIVGVYGFTKEELYEGLRKGVMTKGGKKGYLRDAFLTFALLQLEVRRA
ncbi:MAG TPA: NUDIX hydrolase [Chlamydiales bacterium]|nr:NUDIX hydrolase [Chlamydiales bacterium]